MLIGIEWMLSVSVHIDFGVRGRDVFLLILFSIFSIISHGYIFRDKSEKL